MKLRKILFGLASAVAIIAVVVGKTRGAHPLDIFLYHVYLVVDAPSLALFLVALAAAGYYVVCRLSSRRFDHDLGLVGFALVAFAAVAFLTVSWSKSWPLHDWWAHAVSSAVYCFLLGSILLTALVAWTLMRAVASGLRSRLL